MRLARPWRHHVRDACSLFDTTVKGVHKRIADQPWTEKVLNDLANDEITKTEAMIDIVASAPTAQPLRSN